MKTYLTAIGIFLAITLWMLSGLFGSPSNQTEATKDEMRLSNVRVKDFTAQDKLITVEINGKTQAKRVVDVKAQISGKLIKTPVEKGQYVKQGTVLCQLAEEDRIALLETAKANLTKAQLDYQGNKKLYDKGLLSASVLANSKALLENSQANLSRATLDVEHLKMTAPFDGFVEDRPAEVGALIERGDECARLVDESVVLAVGQANEKEIQQLKLQQKATVQLANGYQSEGVVSFLGRIAEASTRTYRVEITLNADKALRDGLTASMIVPVATVKAQHISPSVLALNEHGEVYLRTVDAKNLVHEVPVKVVAEDNQGVWLTGLPDKSRVIVVGQELVSAGETVNAILVD